MVELGYANRNAHDSTPFWNATQSPQQKKSGGYATEDIPAACVETKIAMQNQIGERRK